LLSAVQKLLASVARKAHGYSIPLMNIDPLNDVTSNNGTCENSKFLFATSLTIGIGLKGLKIF